MYPAGYSFDYDNGVRARIQYGEINYPPFTRNSYAAPARPMFNHYQLIGDSLLVRFADHILHEPNRIINGRRAIGYCVGGQRIDQLRQTLKSAEYPLSSNIMVLIGTNDVLSGYEYETMKRHFNRLLRLLKKKTFNRLLIITLPPVPKLCATFEHWTLLRQYNDYLKSLDDGRKIKVVDICPIFTLFKDALTYPLQIKPETVQKKSIKRSIDRSQMGEMSTPTSTFEKEKLESEGKDKRAKKQKRKDVAVKNEPPEIKKEKIDELDDCAIVYEKKKEPEVIAEKKENIPVKTSTESNANPSNKGIKRRGSIDEDESTERDERNKKIKDDKEIRSSPRLRSGKRPEVREAKVQPTSRIFQLSINEVRRQSKSPESPRSSGEARSASPITEEHEKKEKAKEKGKTRQRSKRRSVVEYSDSDSESDSDSDCRSNRNLKYESDSDSRPFTEVEKYETINVSDDDEKCDEESDEESIKKHVYKSQEDISGGYVEHEKEEEEETPKSRRKNGEFAEYINSTNSPNVIVFAESKNLRVHVSNGDQREVELPRDIRGVRRRKSAWNEEEESDENGNKTRSKDNNDNEYYRGEYRYGEQRRSFSLEQMRMPRSGIMENMKQFEDWQDLPNMDYLVKKEKEADESDSSCTTDNQEQRRPRYPYTDYSFAAFLKEKTQPSTPESPVHQRRVSPITWESPRQDMPERHTSSRHLPFSYNANVPPPPMAAGPTPPPMPTTPIFEHRSSRRGLMEATRYEGLGERDKKLIKTSSQICRMDCYELTYWGNGKLDLIHLNKKGLEMLRNEVYPHTTD